MVSWSLGSGDYPVGLWICVGGMMIRCGTSNFVHMLGRKNAC